MFVVSLFLLYSILLFTSHVFGVYTVDDFPINRAARTQIPRSVQIEHTFFSYPDRNEMKWLRDANDQSFPFVISVQEKQFHNFRIFPSSLTFNGARFT